MDRFGCDDVVCAREPVGVLVMIRLIVATLLGLVCFDTAARADIDVAVIAVQNGSIGSSVGGEVAYVHHGDNTFGTEFFDDAPSGVRYVYAAYLMFPLPKKPDGYTVGSANIRIPEVFVGGYNYEGGVSYTSGVLSFDAYMLPVRSTPTLTVDDYFYGGWMADTGPATPIQPAWLDTSKGKYSVYADYDLSPLGQQSLAGFLQQQYQFASQPAYVVLRINPRLDEVFLRSVKPWDGVYLGMSEIPRHFGAEMNVTFVPEPAMALPLVGVGGSVLLLRRRARA